MATLPTLISCDRRDVGARARMEQTDNPEGEYRPPSICLFDAFAGGVGMAPKIFKAIEEIWRRAQVALCCPQRRLASTRLNPHGSWSGRAGGG